MIERLAIIDHAQHALFIEDVDTELLAEKYNGEEEKYIKDNYELKEGFSWDYIVNTLYVKEDEDPREVNFEELDEKPKEFFEITSVSREDLEAKGFDTSKVSDEQMEELADKMADDYCEQLFWNSLYILAELQGIPKRKFHKGDKVRWNDPGIKDYDPEERKEILARVFTVDETNGDIIHISNEDSSAEVYIDELELVK